MSDIECVNEETIRRLMEDTHKFKHTIIILMLLHTVEIISISKLLGVF